MLLQWGGGRGTTVQIAQAWYVTRLKSSSQTQKAEYNEDNHNDADYVEDIAWHFAFPIVVSPIS